MTVTLVGNIIPNDNEHPDDSYTKQKYNRNLVDMSIISNQETLKKYCSELKYADRDLHFNILYCPVLCNNFPTFIENADKLKFYCNSHGIQYKNKINIIFYGNNSFNYIPFTKWIIFHRMYHAFYMENQSYNDTLSKIIKKLQWEFFKHIDVEKFIYDMVYEKSYYIGGGFRIDTLTVSDFMEKYIKLDSNDTELLEYFDSTIIDHFYNRDEGNISNNSYKNLFTFKSARNKNISSHFEIGAEFFAQKIVQGKCMLQNVDLIDKKYITDSNRESLRSIFNDHEILINNVIDDLILYLKKNSISNNTFYEL
ncbi:MAG: hypothetical protein [Caudoviricetes sp.]|nr:MAG: hypothetical protein [Caudoviricetes sp.]